MSNNDKIQNKDLVNKASGDPLSILNVFERLEIGPVKLEPKRLIAPYRLFYNGKMEQTELICSYEETVFDPAEPESQNLANMIAAQVALNHGLFCNTMVFHGLFGDIDRRFIRDMAENTAREIYVKKFLEPNPFLIGPTAGISPQRRQKYLRAKLQFPQMLRNKARSAWRPWSVQSDKHCSQAFSCAKDGQSASFPFCGRCLSFSLKKFWPCGTLSANNIKIPVMPPTKKRIVSIPAADVRNVAELSACC
jgi:hypothetical protein